MALLLSEIKEGRTYRYVNSVPKKCQGHLYVVLAFIPYVPVYQKLVLVEAMTGPDKGLLFCCSPHNFSTRYEQAEETPVEISNGEVIDGT